jgi:hypothetical protein
MGAGGGDASTCRVRWLLQPDFMHPAAPVLRGRAEPPTHARNCR